MMAADERLNAREMQAAIAHLARRATSQHDAEKGTLAAAVAIMVATYGPALAVERLRDVADLIEHDAVLPDGGHLQ